MKINNHQANVYNFNVNKYSYLKAQKPTFSASYKIGSNIKNLGLIIQEIPVLNKKTKNFENCYLFYKKTNKGGVFSLYKKNIANINELSENLEKNPRLKEKMECYNFYTIPQILEKIKEIDYRTAQLYDELRIAECGFLKIEDNKTKNSLISKGYKPYDDKEFIFIEDYYFDRNKNFDSSGKIVAIPLLKKIIDNKNKNILAIAAAIGEDSYSPANIYFRYGFKPFTQTKEEIEKQIIKTPKGDRINPKYAIPVYLPDDAKLYEIIKRYKGLDEIDKIYSNWL